jgi:hypothetical protein
MKFLAMWEGFYWQNVKEKYHVEDQEQMAE